MFIIGHGAGGVWTTTRGTRTVPQLHSSAATRPGTCEGSSSMSVGIIIISHISIYCRRLLIVLNCHNSTVKKSDLGIKFDT